MLLYPLPVEEDFPQAFCRMDPYPTGDIWAQAFFSPTEHQDADQSLPDIHSSCCIICQCVFCTTKKENPDCRNTCCTHHHLPLNPAMRKAFVPLCHSPAWADAQTHSWYHHHPLLRGKQALTALYPSSSFTSQSGLFPLGTGAQHWFNSPQFDGVCFHRPTTIILTKQRRKQRSCAYTPTQHCGALLQHSLACPSCQPTTSSNPRAPAPGWIFLVRRTFTAELHQWHSHFCGCKL